MMSKALTLLALAALLGVSMAACPNSCSGHGTCDSSGKCTCYLEGKALYLGASYDPTAGMDPRDLLGAAKEAGNSLKKVATVEVANDSVFTTLATSGTTVDTVDTADFTVTDGGAGYMDYSGAGTCSADTAWATYSASKCPIIGLEGGTDGTVGVTAQCRATVGTTGTDKGKITRVVCTSVDTNYASDTASGSVVSVSFPNFDGFNLKPPSAQWTAPDCSLMTCPRGMSWISVDTAAQTSSGEPLLYTHVDDAECSDGGVCDRASGTCVCNPGFEGSACQRTACPEGCSGHGICQSNIKFAAENGARYLSAWDSGKEFGCKCDSGWRGLACTMQECPSSTDPLSWQGNNEGRDCSGRGLCDYSSGLCSCFDGYTGNACQQVQALA